MKDLPNRVLWIYKIESDLPKAKDEVETLFEDLTQKHNIAFDERESQANNRSI